MASRDHSRHIGYQILKSKTHPDYVWWWELGIPCNWIRVTSAWAWTWREAGVAAMLGWDSRSKGGCRSLLERARSTLIPVAILTPYPTSPQKGKSSFYLWSQPEFTFIPSVFLKSGILKSHNRSIKSEPRIKLPQNLVAIYFLRQCHRKDHFEFPLWSHDHPTWSSIYITLTAKNTLKQWRIKKSYDVTS